MAEDAREPPDADEFWRFSLAFYARPGVEKALLFLQDAEGIDVNLVLYALWLGASGRGPLDKEGLERAERRVSHLREEVVKPLRALRRRLKASPEPDLVPLYEEAKRLELSAEKVEEARLAALSGPGRVIGPEKVLAEASSGLALYLGAQLHKGEAARALLLALKAAVRQE